MATVALVFGGRSVEHRVSVVSARSVAAALVEAGHEVVPLGIAEDGCWIGVEASRAAIDGGVDALAPLGLPAAPTLRHLLASRAEVVFPLVHGTWGEDGTLQGLLEMLDLPYVGAGVLASAAAMDKLACKRLHVANGVPVVDYVATDRIGYEADPEAFAAEVEALGFPVFVKPSVGGSSVGVQKVVSAADLAAAVRLALRFDDRVLVERGIVGRELECAVLGYPELTASAVGEIVPGAEFYDYADKYLRDDARLIAPAELSEADAARVRQLAVRAFAAVHGEGMARVDFFFTADGELLVNEINTVPGFTRISMYPRLWGLSGLPLPALVDRLVELARRRHADRGRLDAGIKDWLRTLDV